MHRAGRARCFGWNKWRTKAYTESSVDPMAFQLPKLRHAVAVLSLAFLSGLASFGQTVATTPLNRDMATAAAQPDALGIRPEHLWTAEYVHLLWDDTGAVLTAPARWDDEDWMYAGFAAASLGAAASLDQTVKVHVQAHRTASEDRFFKQYQNFGSTWSFGVIGAFEIWGEAAGNTTAKNTAMAAFGQFQPRVPSNLNPSVETSLFHQAMSPKPSQWRLPSRKTTRNGGCRHFAMAELAWWATPASSKTPITRATL